MSDVATADRPTGTVPRGLRWAGLALVAAVLVVIGNGAGDATASPERRSGSAYVGTDQASITVDDWTYGIAQGVAWIDRSGSREDGWPDCLDVPAGTLVENVRFATVDVDVDGAGWREVVLVDCR